MTPGSLQHVGESPSNNNWTWLHNDEAIKHIWDGNLYLLLFSVHNVEVV